MAPWNVLVVSNSRTADLVHALLDWGVKVYCCRTIAQARKVLAREPVSQVFCNARLPDGSYRDLVRIAKVSRPEARVVVLVPQHSRERIRQEATQAGASATLRTPARRPEVQWEVLEAMRKSSPAKAA
jgi:DNA-binding NtrC family response regulator